MNCVLVVDDDIATRETLSDVLRSEGYDVVSAANGSSALNYLRLGARPNLILIDLMMTPINGYEFRQAQLADSQLAEIPAVAFTAQSIRDEDRLQGMRVLRKPVDLEVLLAAVASALNESLQQPN